jgi:hypothetical protein
MMRTWPLAAVALLGGCGKGMPMDRPLSVSEVVDNIDALNSKRVSVRGYLGRCAPLDCELFVTRADHEKWWENFAKASRGERYERDHIVYLSIGSSADFDRKAESLQNRKVLITGTVSNNCLRGFFRFFKRRTCTDRADDIRPIDITALKEI